MRQLELLQFIIRMTFQCAMCWRLNRMTVTVLFILLSSLIRTTVQEEPDAVKQALEYVQRARTNCSGDDVLPLEFDHSHWNDYAETAIRTANLVTMYLRDNNNNLDSVDERLFYRLCQRNVHGDTPIVGSAIAVEPGIFSKYERFSPFAYKDHGVHRALDISLNYNYLEPHREWYNAVKNATFETVTMVTDIVQYRNGSTMLNKTQVEYPSAVLAEGYWTNPYYDCGAAEIWMVTYSSPIFTVRNGTAVFGGVATIDISLRNIDINQCDVDDTSTGSAVMGVFRGSHRCQPTTKCIHIPGSGFVPNSYICECQRGYYFPYTSATAEYYNGSDIETFYRQNPGSNLDKFRCSVCSPGCTECVNDSPCLVERNDVLMYCLSAITSITVIGLICIAIVTFIYSEVSVFKSASPTFLGLMWLGGIIMCTQLFTYHFETSVLLCRIQIWPLHLGFSVMYSSLILKTWRISVIFTTGTTKRVYLPDQALLKRFGIILALTVVGLAAWTAGYPPEITTLLMGDNLKFYECNYGQPQYAALGVEILCLLYGVYLCFTVRKAPALFNESRHITWAIYNAVILGTSLTAISKLAVEVVGPDVPLGLLFARIQVYVTVTAALIFVPKFIALYTKTEPPATRSHGEKFPTISHITMSTPLAVHMHSRATQTGDNDDVIDGEGVAVKETDLTIYIDEISHVYIGTCPKQ